MRNSCFTALAFEQYNEWPTTDKTVFKRLNKLILDTAKNPFVGVGKPEPLKNELKGSGVRELQTNIDWCIGLVTLPYTLWVVSIIISSFLHDDTM